MLSPDYLLHISEGAEEISEGLHQYIVSSIVRRMLARLGRGEDYLLTPMDKWQMDVLQDSGFLLEDIQRELVRVTGIQQEEIRSAMEEAGVEAMRYDDAVYKTAGISTTALPQSPYLVRLMQRNYEATMGEWANFTRTTADAAQQLFIREMDKAYHLTASGAVSYTQAVKEAVNEVVKDGVVVHYPTGHRDTIETATLRAVRTGVGQMSGQISMARMEELDWDIILVSAHLGARYGDGGPNPGNHAWWQGKFYSRTGRDKRFPDFKTATGYGTGEGLCGWNCWHSFGAGDGENNPFRRIDSEENRKAYDLSQRQRALERRIRRTKREVMGMKMAVDSTSDELLKAALDADYQRKANLLQRQNRAYNEFCEENGLKRLSDRLQIAKWDRAQAAAARGAAKRYRNSR